MTSHLHSARRPRLDAATAAVRLGVRRSLENCADGSAVLACVSGGADSMALAAALAFEASPLSIRVHSITVDHGLQTGSDAVAHRTADTLTSWGIDAQITRVHVTEGGGPEAAARDARYRAIDEEAERIGADLVLLGHTLDDQAETVLLGLARGSGAGSLKGMAPLTGRYARPLLGVRREQTRASCVARGIEVWDDPQNGDAVFTRVRVRNRVLPVLEQELGPGIAEALARTAEQSREDEDAFEQMIEEFIEEVCEPAEAGIAVEVSALEHNPAALRHRLIRYIAHAEFGASLSRSHTLAIAALVTDWRGQGPIDVPGIAVSRTGGRIVFTAAGKTPPRQGT
ncbi:tRNA lysidine(34) synthetase TilS [Microbacterium sp. MPKO10]|uniref:tRNA lysidine(34) synthetase TilS n=1 Tax=Microbacterium sp. MPKO10 TaxID=2989818 RepID=UPI002236BA28|nr:tRNA lysidine(34) synthetase TilS [Microbacterium sp. MPKO10]MCW4458840.1 tRNA lysidine(34) synthetase TilS [Microbacterium sp. MPKO10]